MDPEKDGHRLVHLIDDISNTLEKVLVIVMTKLSQGRRRRERSK